MKNKDIFGALVFLTVIIGCLLVALMSCSDSSGSYSSSSSSYSYDRYGVRYW